MKLMEVNDDLLSNLKAGKRLVIRGEKTDHAVLCTDNTTYDLKLAETTNGLLLVPDGVTSDSFVDNTRSLEHKQVAGLIHTYFELKPTRPKLKKVRVLLEDSEYEGAVEEGAREITGKLYTTDDLLDIVQASEDEIFRELAKIQACTINGHWRLLSFEYKSRVIASILNLVEENSWHLSAVPLDEVLNTLDNLEPRCILKHVLACYSEKSKQNNESESILYSLNEDKICQHYAEALLRNSGKFNLEEFMAAWQQCVPEGMKTDPAQLKGIALVDKTSFPEVIFRYHIDDLPEGERERFNALFKMKRKWTMDEIKPYVEELTSEKVSIGALLQKHARASTGPNGVKYFNSKHPVK
ncbi:sister chromatid cohesion protein DCC1-like [Anneissia japonica]|uniref:sister chromatid cohesion protein DCC1-like n=1 Tax=Anneissia japonica TaxID=1529436 RepID=UPI001425AF77|nr:sister chromatid cohesion protein DCC1-like [Anneissia japonica]